MNLLSNEISVVEGSFSQSHTIRIPPDLVSKKPVNVQLPYFCRQDVPEDKERCPITRASLFNANIRTKSEKGTSSFIIICCYKLGQKSIRILRCRNMDNPDAHICDSYLF